MKMVPLGDIAEFVRGVTFKPADKLDGSVGVPVMRTKNVQRDLDLSDMIRVPSTLVKRETQYLQPGDTLVSSANSWNLVGKCCWVPELDEPMAIGGFVTALRADRSRCEPRYLYHWFASPRIQATVRSLGNQTTNIANLSVKRSLRLELPLPPLDEQRRIAAILDKADAIRQKRRQAIIHLDTLTQSIFHEMFGEDERANFELREICTLRSGGTPSKQENGFWNGDIPWFSLKDLKHDRLTDSIDHVTERSIQQTTLRTIAKDTILVGVRGMILAHTVPISLLKVDGTINQDVKALEVTESFTPEFLHAAMKGNHSYLLSQVTTAAHGTKRLESNALLSARIPCATSAEQIDFTSKIAHWAAVHDRIKQLASGGDQLFASLQSRAFRGEL